MSKVWLSTMVFSIPGMWLLAALDSTPFFKLPLGIDTAVIVVSSLHPRIFWLCGLSAAVASLSGAALTFYIGRRAGEFGLRRFMSEERAARVKVRCHSSGAVGLALLDLVPPPFPFTACILAAGALEVNRKRFFVTLLLGRSLRFGLESALAVLYGQQIIGWLESWHLYNSVAFLLTIGVAAGIATAIVAVRRITSTLPSPRRQ
jgi:membrane protein YqaA with SNARE-associated domain